MHIFLMVLVWIINQTFCRIYENLTTVILCKQKLCENPPLWPDIRNVLLSNRQTESRKKWKQGLIVGDVPSILERGCNYNQVDSAVMCLGFLSEISFSGLFAYIVWCDVFLLTSQQLPRCLERQLRQNTSSATCLTILTHDDVLQTVFFFFRKLFFFCRNFQDCNYHGSVSPVLASMSTWPGSGIPALCGYRK